LTDHDRLVLVTGATGFIGGRLVESLVLDHGMRVRVLVRNFTHAHRIARFPVELVSGDVTDAASVAAAMRGVDHVFHCVNDPSSPIETTRRGAELVADAALAEGCGRLVYLSSNMAYGEELHGRLAEESSYQDSTNPYVEGKRQAETALLDRHRVAGLPVVVLQPTIVYGPYGSFWTRHCLELLAREDMPLLDGGTNPCNAVYVDDVVAAMLLAASVEEAVGGTYLVSAAEPTDWQSFYGAFAEMLGIDATRVVSAAELEAIRARSRPAGPPRPGATTAARAGMKALARDPDVRALLKRLPVSRPVRRRVRSTAKRLVGVGPSPSPPGAGTVKPAEERRPLHLPGDILMKLFRSTARVEIDRAHRDLGYEPAFDLERGMAMTEAYARWAGLAPTVRAGDR
jgi:nucleoside-diphosphate-sugar epimerase